MEKIKKVVPYVFLAGGAISILRTIYILWNTFLPDFSTRYQAVRVLFGGNNPYSNLSSFTSENYPPIALILISPVTLFPFEVSSKILIILSVLSLIFCIVLLHRALNLPLLQTSFLFFFASISFPFKFTVGMGQLNLLVLFFLTLFLFGVIKGKIFAASISIAIASSLKLFPGILLLVLLIQRKWKIFFISSFAILILFLTSFVLFDKDITLFYIRKILVQLILGSSGAEYYNQSITGLFSRFNINTGTLTLSRIFIFLLTVCFILRRRELSLGIPLFMTMILLSSNFTWQHNLILLLLPFAVLLKKSSLTTQMFMLIAYFLIAMNIKNPTLITQEWYGPIALSHSFFGMLILWSLLVFKKNDQ